NGQILMQSQNQTNIIGGGSSLELMPGLAKLDGTPMIQLNGGGTPLAGLGYAVQTIPVSGTGTIVQGNPTVFMGGGEEKSDPNHKKEKENKN
ncbi:MAG: hypothetical protein K8R53_15145, partial [Bacteroidales bacterium]|nr:hypothetical protein [Bacteroidales bacterium]